MMRKRATYLLVGVVTFLGGYGALRHYLVNNGEKIFQPSVITQERVVVYCFNDIPGFICPFKMAVVNPKGEVVVPVGGNLHPREDLYFGHNIIIPKESYLQLADVDFCRLGGINPLEQLTKIVHVLTISAKEVRVSDGDWRPALYATSFSRDLEHNRWIIDTSKGYPSAPCYDRDGIIVSKFLTSLRE